MAKLSDALTYDPSTSAVAPPLLTLNALLPKTAAVAVVAPLGGGEAAPIHPAAAPNVQPPSAPTQGKSGSWPIIPLFPGIDLLKLTWDYDAAGGTADIKVVFIFWDINTLSGSISKDKTVLQDSLSLDVVTGDLTVQLTPGAAAGSNGLSVSGDLTAFGKKIESFDYWLLRW